MCKNLYVKKSSLLAGMEEGCNIGAKRPHLERLKDKKVSTKNNLISQPGRPFKREDGPYHLWSSERLVGFAGRL